MEVIQRLGAMIQADWQCRDTDIGAFSEVAAAALRACAALREISRAELLAEDATSPTVFSDPRFEIDVITTAANTSELREASAPAVIMVICGTCLYSHDDFEAEHDYGDRVWVGHTAQRELASLEAGDLRVITPGSAYTLFHCDRASFSIVVRISQARTTERCYLRSGIAYVVAPGSAELDRQIDVLDSLLHSDEEHFVRCLRELLGAADLATACGLVRRYFPRVGARVCRAVVPDGAPARAALLAAVIDHAIHAQRAAQLAAIRRTLRVEHHRWLLAVLLGAADRRDVLRLVALRAPDEDPVDTILAWLDQLAAEPSDPPGRSNALGVELDDVMRFATSALMQGSSDGEVAAAMAEELEDAADLREDVIALCRSLRQSILAPLFAEPVRRSWPPPDLAVETAWLVGDRYQVLERIGEGGMGIVYRVLDRHRSQICALKAVAMPREQSPELRAQFAREVEIARAMAHPAIVAVIDTGEDDRLGRFMVMELVEGLSLDRRLARAQRLPLRAACTVVRQVAEAVDYVHHHGIAHGDIKPGNIFVIGDPTGGPEPSAVKLFDFGRARSFTTAQPTTSLVGTPLYLAPELIRGDGASPASDIYALGIVLYELVTGRPPWIGAVRDILRGHLEQLLPALESVDRCIDPALEALIRRATAKRPEERPQTAGELIAELDRIILSLAAS